MDYFKNVIQYLPSNWDKETYHNKTYILVDLVNDSEEYVEILQYCNVSGINNVTEIKRIQHPFAYLRFQLKLEFHREWGNSIGTAKRSHISVSDADLEMYIKHNCDPRRRNVHVTQSNYVIRKMIHDHPERDTNWYPEYLVKIE